MGVGRGGENQNKAKLSSISNEMMQISTFSVGWVGVGVEREMKINTKLSSISIKLTSWS